MIDWSKLDSYDNSRYRSYEELCYQIAKGLYGHLGEFTPIDDSGGGDGIEFYMTLPSSEQWGWQAKFYYPDGRLQVSNRKQAIKNSLKTACKHHPELKKWILCTPTNFTPSERRWFEQELPKSVPHDRSVELIHWNQSDFSNWLSEPRFCGKRNYFFGTMDLSLGWFRLQTEKQLESIKDKFNPLLHTETMVDDQIHAFLADIKFAEKVKSNIEVVKSGFEDFEASFKKLNGKHWRIQLDPIIKDLVPKCTILRKNLLFLIERLEETYALIAHRDLQKLRELDWDDIWTQVNQSYRDYSESVSEFDVALLEYTGEYTGTSEDKSNAIESVERVIQRPASNASNLLDDFYYVLFPLLKHIHKVDMHVLGNAGYGKTHLASHICFTHLEQKLPALLVLGRNFTSDRTIEEQLIRILDIPAAFSWHDFILTLESVGEAYQSRIPIVIDGLNESILNGGFSNVWTNGLNGFVKELHQFKYVVLLTTCRTTYREEIYSDKPSDYLVWANGFQSEDVQLAIDKYFEWYKIKADMSTAAIIHFIHPIYLKIFCESQNPERLEEKHIFIGEQTLFEVFDSYLQQCNKLICQRLGRHPRLDILTTLLTQVVSYLWTHKSRSVPFTNFVTMADNKSLTDLNWESSVAKHVIDEGLLICRDLMGGTEVVYFTYDLLGGYSIAKWLVERSKKDMHAFFTASENVDLLFSNEYGKLHPLHSDIVRCIAAVLPVETRTYLHELLEDAEAFNASVNALFEIPSQYIDEKNKKLIADLLTVPKNREPLFKRALFTVGHVEHPFNATFWSERLHKFSMPERDASWSEFIRGHKNEMKMMMLRFENACQSIDKLTDQTTNRLALYAEFIMWTLTTTVRSLRDLATKVLYWFGRRCPDKWLDLIEKFFVINDPYVSERMLAATYGVVMAKQYDIQDADFQQKILPALAKRLYEAMFSPNALYSTTHIMARDYASRTIEIAIRHHPSLLTTEEVSLTKRPYTIGGIRNWGQYNEDVEGEQRRMHSPIRMDFGNYTIGRLIKGRGNYDYNHPDYRLVRSNILWRVYDLGYSSEVFAEIDSSIADENWRSGRSEDGRKTDRYGKKYSWIAYFEMAGYRQDQGLLKEWHDEERLSDIDIDPSFPDTVQEINLICSDFLGDRNIPVEDWIKNDDKLDINEWLVISEIEGELGPWVLLDGYINQQDISAQRERFIFPRGLLVKKRDAKSLESHLIQQDLGGRWLPEIKESNYLYAGEIPWCETFPYNGWEELEFITKTSVVQEIEKKEVVCRNDKPLSEEKENQFWSSIEGVFKAGNVLITTGSVDAETAIAQALQEHGYHIKELEVPVEREINEKKTFKVMLPVYDFSWSESTSDVNPGIGVLLPSKEIMEYLDLRSRPQTFDMYDCEGKRATICLEFGEKWKSRQQLVYIRKNLLDSYLNNENFKLIWAIWGEKEFYIRDSAKKEEFLEEYVDRKVFQEIISYV